MAYSQELAASNVHRDFVSFKNERNKLFRLLMFSFKANPEPGFQSEFKSHLVPLDFEEKACKNMRIGFFGFEIISNLVGRHNDPLYWGGLREAA